VLGTEQNREPCAVRGAQEVNVSSSLSVDAGVVGQQTETFTSDEMCRVGKQHFDAGPNLGSDG